jgi:cytoskeletal protein CcmA (bactofilin family)
MQHEVVDEWCERRGGSFRAGHGCRALARASVTVRGSVDGGDGSHAMPGSRSAKSISAAGLTVEGSIDGRGHVRVRGRFKGTVTVAGEVTIERGGLIEGELRADRVRVLGEVRGRIVATSWVEVAPSGRLIGELTTRNLVVAAGSKMRGHVEFGWAGATMEEATARSTGPDADGAVR